MCVRLLNGHTMILSPELFTKQLSLNKYKYDHQHVLILACCVKIGYYLRK